MPSPKLQTCDSSTRRQARSVRLALRTWRLGGRPTPREYRPVTHHTPRQAPRTALCVRRPFSGKIAESPHSQAPGASAPDHRHPLSGISGRAGPGRMGGRLCVQAHWPHVPLPPGFSSTFHADVHPEDWQV